MPSLYKNEKPISAIDLVSSKTRMLARAIHELLVQIKFIIHKFSTKILSLSDFDNCLFIKYWNKNKILCMLYIYNRYSSYCR